MPTLNEMMNAKTQDMMARYDNARTAVGEGYRHACRNACVEDTKVVGADGRVEYISATQEAKDAELVRYARFIAKNVEADLNAALKILEVENATETAGAKIPRLN